MGSLEGRTASTIRESGGSALALVCDVSDPQQVAAAFERADAELGVADILFANAGIVGPEASAPDTAIEEFDRCVGSTCAAPSPAALSSSPQRGRPRRPAPARR